MDDTLKALVARCWKDAELDLEVGTTCVDETFVCRVRGSVVKQSDTMVAPTTSIPLISTLAFFCEKAGIVRSHALEILKASIADAMANNTAKSVEIQSRMKDVEAAVQAVKDELIAKLPKVKRSGRVIVQNLEIEVLPIQEETLVPAA